MGMTKEEKLKNMFKDNIRTKPVSEDYEKNYDEVFGKRRFWYEKDEEDNKEDSK